MRRLLACAVVLAGCSPHVNKCKDKTLFVSVTLDDTAKSADQIVVDLSIDGGTPVHGTLAHKPGQSMGGVEVQFPKGYPAGRTIAVTLTATLAGTTVGEGSVQQTLATGCDTLTIHVISSQSPNDLAGSDGTPPDLFAAPDGSDLLQPQNDGANHDLVMCAPVAEDCFNGVDDDCDGLVDCADPDCTGGVSPRAVCVPDPGSFTAGVTVSGSCPGAWPSPAPINSGLNPGSCANGTCSCSLTNNTCLVFLNDYGADPTCTGSHSAGGYTQNVCELFSPPASGSHYDIVGGYFGGCIAGTGDAPVNTPPSWSNTQQFCSGGAVGAGCSLGNRCVPVGPNHCVIKAGTQLACPANYTLRTIHYFTGFNDSTRMCACDACAVNTNGTCSGTANEDFFASTDNTCSADAISLVEGTCSNVDLSSRTYMLPSGMSLSTAATCKPGGASQTGSTVAINEQTVCCTP